MKKLLRIYAIELWALYVADQVAGGLVFQERLTGMIVTAGAMALASLVVRPIINILILPLSLATLGLLKFLSHAVMLYLVDFALVQFKVEGFYFAGLKSPYLDLPAVNYDNGVMAYIAFSLIIATVAGLVHWLTK